ncbi:MAG: hypothetical protein PHS32_05245 [Rhodoferax sp.]|uniref:hypothetical protein n=1 Tax=Rhodoferax sp. TaxID=50421 RepID=UPI00263588CF|nr:hypothetical protein [Rhodoferax sp.]MDD5333133.1 hypothetical protein [Rhodoferax sp.]
MNRSVLIGLASGLAILTLGALWVMTGTQGDTLSPPNPTTAAPRVAASGVSPYSVMASVPNKSVDGAGSAGAGQPEWAASTTRSASATAPTTGKPEWAMPTARPAGPANSAAAPTAGQPGAPSIEAIQQRLQAQVAGGKVPSPKELDAALSDLQRNQGKDVIGGVNIAALRENLARVERLRQIALEVQAIASNPQKQDQARLQVLMTEVRTVQTAMQSSASATAPIAK